eukprot:12148186-Alexandrium_andersonii.AAC.1
MLTAGGGGAAAAARHAARSSVRWLAGFSAANLERTLQAVAGEGYSAPGPVRICFAALMPPSLALAKALWMSRRSSSALLSPSWGRWWCWPRGCT